MARRQAPTVSRQDVKALSTKATRVASVLACGVVVCFASAARRQAATFTAYVAEVKGNWVTARARTTILTIGDTLLAGDTIFPRSLDAGRQSIAIVLRSGLAAHRCAFTGGKDRPGCSILVVPPATAMSRYDLARDLVRTKIASLLRSEPAQYESLVSRGAGPGLLDGVVPLHGSTLDLSEILAPLDAGKYRVCLKPANTVNRADSGTASAACPTTAAISWDPRRAASGRVDGLRSGLYVVHIAGKDWQNSALILASDSARFIARRAAFAEFASRSQEWSGTISTSTRRRLLRAYLEALADSGATASEGSRNDP